MCPQKIALLTDSCADLAPAVAEENHIYIVPLRILCADGEYSCLLYTSPRPRD